MKCDSCGVTLRLAKENYRYRESGLPNIVLKGIEIRRCGKCGDEEVVLPRLAELHRVIARAIAGKSARLSGEEIRFLRKYLGWSGADFARCFSVAPESVSRWENESQAMSPPAEKLLRVCSLAMEPISDYSILEDMGQLDPDDRLLYFTLKNRWQRAA